MLGADLAAAHFIAFRDGKVKFQGSDQWHVRKPRSDDLPTLPKFYDPSWRTEALDCSGMTLVYEGLPNIRNYRSTFSLEKTICNESVATHRGA